MKFYLAKNQLVTFGKLQAGSDRKVDIELNLVPYDDHNKMEKDSSEELTRMLSEKYPRIFDPYWKASITVRLSDNSLRISCSGLQNLARVTAGHDVKVKVCFSNIYIVHTFQPKKYSMSTDYFPLLTNATNTYHELNGLFSKMFDHWKNLHNIYQGEVTIEMTCDEENVHVLQPPTTGSYQPFCIAQKILAEAVASDMVIVGADQKEVKCHKAFLAVHSPVLKAMLVEGNFAEARTGRLEMVEVCEDGVKAFLSFLYNWNLEAPLQDFSLALDLLQIGHKYDIKTLVGAMRDILLTYHVRIIPIDEVLALFVFAWNLGGEEGLKMKAAEILKGNLSLLEKSQNYQLLFQSNPEAAMELCKLAFSA